MKLENSDVRMRLEVEKQLLLQSDDFDVSLLSKQQGDQKSIFLDHGSYSVSQVESARSELAHKVKNPTK